MGKLKVGKKNIAAQLLKLVGDKNNKHANNIQQNFRKTNSDKRGMKNVQSLRALAAACGVKAVLTNSEVEEMAEFLENNWWYDEKILLKFKKHERPTATEASFLYKGQKYSKAKMKSYYGSSAYKLINEIASGSEKSCSGLKGVVGQGNTKTYVDLKNEMRGVGHWSRKNAGMTLFFKRKEDIVTIVGEGAHKTNTSYKITWELKDSFKGCGQVQFS